MTQITGRYIKTEQSTETGTSEKLGASLTAATRPIWRPLLSTRSPAASSAVTITDRLLLFHLAFVPKLVLEPTKLDLL